MESKLSTSRLLPGTQRAVPFVSCICVFAPVAPAPSCFSHTCLSGKHDSDLQVTLLKCPLLYGACLNLPAAYWKLTLLSPPQLGNSEKNSMG